MKSIRFYTTLLLLILPAFAFSEDKPIFFLDTGGHTGIINDVLTAENGKKIVTASDDKTIRVWDIATQKESRKIGGQVGSGVEGGIYTIALSSGDQYLASSGCPEIGWGSDFKYIRIYKYSSGQLIKILKSHENTVLDLCFSEDGKYLLSASSDGSVKLWNGTPDFALQYTFSDHFAEVYACKIFKDAADYKIVTASYDNQVLMYSLNTKKQLGSFDAGHKMQFLAVSDKYIAASGESRNLYIFDKMLNLQTTLTCDTIPAGMTFSPDGKLLAVGSLAYPNFVTIYSVISNYSKVAVFKKYDNIVKALTFLDARTIVTGGGSLNMMFIWDAYTMEDKGRIIGAGLPVWSVGIADKKIAIGNTGRRVHKDPLKFNKILDLNDYTVTDLKKQRDVDTNSFKPLPTKYNNLEIYHTNSGTYGYPDDTIVILKDGRIGQKILRDSYNGYRHRVYGFSTDGFIISGGANGQLEAYDSQGVKIASFIGHTSDIWSLSLDDDFLASGSDDQTVILWNLKELKEGKTEINPMLTIFLSKDNDWVIYSKSGYYNCTENGRQYVKFIENKGKDKESVYKAADQYPKYFKPSVISNMLIYRNEDDALHN